MGILPVVPVAGLSPLKGILNLVCSIHYYVTLDGECPFEFHLTDRPLRIQLTSSLCTSPPP